MTSRIQCMLRCQSVCVVYFNRTQKLCQCAECVYCECLYLSLHSERDHPSSPSSSRPESEYVPPPVYQPPEVTRSTLQPPRKHNLDYLTSNPAYNLSTSLREELLNDETCSNFNRAYGVSPVNLNLSRLRPAPPGNPPPVYYDNQQRRLCCRHSLNLYNCMNHYLMYVYWQS